MGRGQIEIDNSAALSYLANGAGPNGCPTLLGGTVQGSCRLNGVDLWKS